MVARTNYSSTIKMFRDIVREEIGNRQSIRSIFDIGSCHGLESATFSNVYPNAEINTFEANPIQIPIILEHTKDCSNVTVHEVAVNDYNGVCKFYPIDKQKSRSAWFDSNQGASSLFRVNGTESLMHASESYVQSEIEVPCIRLDTFCETKNIDPPQIIWMDLQGAEFKALKGLGNLIDDVEFIWTEMEIEPLYHDQDLFETIHPWLLDKGFALLGKNLARNKRSGDFVYMRKNR